MLHVGKVIGLPLKVFEGQKIHLPAEYLKYYGLPEGKGRLKISILGHSVFYQALLDSNYTKKNTRAIKTGLTVLPSQWAKENGVKVGDCVFLLGTLNGLLLYIRK